MHYAFVSLELPIALHAQNSHKVLKFYVCMYTLAIPHCRSSCGHIIMPTGSRGMSMYRMIAIKLKSVMTGKTCTGMHALYYSEWHIRHKTCSSLLTTRLEESATGEKEHDAESELVPYALTQSFSHASHQSGHDSITVDMV